jgi:hypothetical protein
VPVQTGESVRQGLGDPSVRILYFDCDGGWATQQDAAGVVVMPPGTQAAPGAELELQARDADGKPSVHLYRMAAGSATLELVGLPVELSGPLAFLGYRVLESESTPEEGSIEIHTVWRVLSQADRPLSIMAHAAEANQAVVEIRDGLCYPVEQWQTGDILIQRHRFEHVRIGDSARYEITIGAYWLDTMQRWQTTSGTDVIARILLGP